MAITTKGSNGNAVSVGAGNYAIVIPALDAPINSIIVIDWAYNNASGGVPLQTGTFRTGGTGVAINILMKDPGVGAFITWTAVAISIT